MQSPPKPCAFESDLALLLSAFVAEKQRLGFKYNSIEAYLKSFDTFLLGKDCKNSLSKELMLEWIAPKAHQSATTIEHRIHIMQRLTDFLNRNGFPAYLHFQLPYKTPSRRKKSQPQYHKVIQGHLLPAFTIYEGDEQKDRQDLLGRY